MSRDLTIHNVPFNHFYRDLSYRDFFNRYHPKFDGRVYISTGSFRPERLDFWAKFPPISRLYVGGYKQEYRDAARRFVRRFPLFEIRVVKALHAKVIFFEDSGTLLVGSENLYSPTSTFLEASVETHIPEKDRAKIVDLLFGSYGGEVVLPTHTLDDIRLHPDGRPFAPCHREVHYYDLVARIVTLPSFKPPEREVLAPGRIYHILEYRPSGADGPSHFLAFDRGYGYVGDLDEEAARWLLSECAIDHEQDSGLIPFEDVPPAERPAKDRIFEYHPVASLHRPTRGYWIQAVRDRGKHTARVEKLPEIDITNRKIRERDFPD